MMDFQIVLTWSDTDLEFFTNTEELLMWNIREREISFLFFPVYEDNNIGWFFDLSKTLTNIVLNQVGLKNGKSKMTYLLKNRIRLHVLKNQMR